MMRLLLVEWLISEGIIFYRDVQADHHIPMPGQLLAASGVFVLLAFLAEAGPGAAQLATTLGGGFVLAAGLNLFAKIGNTAATGGASKPKAKPAVQTA
jgi:hypothetical protein